MDSSSPAGHAIAWAQRPLDPNAGFALLALAPNLLQFPTPDPPVPYNDLVETLKDALRETPDTDEKRLVAAKALFNVIDAVRWIGIPVHADTPPNPAPPLHAVQVAAPPEPEPEPQPAKWDACPISWADDPPLSPARPPSSPPQSLGAWTNGPPASPPNRSAKSPKPDRPIPSPAWSLDSPASQRHSPRPRRRDRRDRREPLPQPPSNSPKVPTSLWVNSWDQRFQNIRQFLDRYEGAIPRKPVLVERIRRLYGDYQNKRTVPDRLNAVNSLCALIDKMQECGVKLPPAKS